MTCASPWRTLTPCPPPVTRVPGPVRRARGTPGGCQTFHHGSSAFRITVLCGNAETGELGTRRRSVTGLDLDRSWLLALPPRHVPIVTNKVPIRKFVSPRLPEQETERRREVGRRVPLVRRHRQPASARKWAAATSRTHHERRFNPRNREAAVREGAGGSKPKTRTSQSMAAGKSR